MASWTLHWMSSNERAVSAAEFQFSMDEIQRKHEIGHYYGSNPQIPWILSNEINVSTAKTKRSLEFIQ
ncbi:hypothetical protein [Paenibacillus silvestris]|uniref:hypothetical protein n=1 Tax=Paenibacillus silvestris TaxID=2606219 RepID=UPI001372A9F9|nr:hypothetical protein [Paenibacillus silvestris]